MRKVTFTKWDDAGYTLQEDINTLVTNIKFSGDNIHSVCITSSNENEGKSFVSMELSRAFAQDGKRVILIDADLRKSRIEWRYGMEGAEGASGLSHYLCGLTDQIGDIILQSEKPSFDLILAGQAVVNPPTLLGSDRFKDLIKQLEAEYDLVIVDCPPICAVIDGAVVSTAVNGVILVVAQNGCSRKDLRYVNQQLENVNANVIGAVLNMRRHSSSGYGNYGKYGKYSKYGKYKSYGKYGHTESETASDNQKESK